MTTFITKVIEDKKAGLELRKKKLTFKALEEMIADRNKRAFSDVFRIKSDDTRIIAEIKRISPTAGILNTTTDVISIAKKYEKGMANAVSVITEENHFGGNLQMLAEISEAVSLPVLRKDFIVDDYELLEARAFGASAALLIVAACRPAQIRHLLSVAAQIDLDILLEIHSLKEYETISDLSGFIIGINNRDLHTLKVDISTSLSILPEIPKEIPVIIESGITVRSEIESFLTAGASGFLIGTAIMSSGDPVGKLAELKG